MGATTGIAWTDATYNPWMGCEKVSAGCRECYMFREMRRYGKDPTRVVRSKTTFYAPLKWKTPRRVFTCSWSDFFIEQADEWRYDAWEIIRRTPQHTYQILTKRPERVAEHVPWPASAPWPNVWLGVSVENQDTAAVRIPQLARLSAAVKFVSAEPLIGPINLGLASPCGYYCDPRDWPDDPLFGHHDHDFIGSPGRVPAISWVIIGGESGPNARPMSLVWVSELVKTCATYGVAAFVKQLGARPFWPANTVADDPQWMPLVDPKGANPAEWPEDLRVRQFPAPKFAEVK